MTATYLGNTGTALLLAGVISGVIWVNALVRGTPYIKPKRDIAVLFVALFVLLTVGEAARAQAQPVVLADRIRGR